jgi:CRP/FNR family nitrogen fixation transcriptional regulator
MSASLTVAAKQGQIAPQAAIIPLPTNAHAECDGLKFAGVSINFAADQQIYAAGDEARCFYKVISGVVRTCRFFNDGHRQIDAFYRDGDVFGFEAGSDHCMSAEAVTGCTVIAYRRRGIETMLCQDDRLSHWFLSHAMNTVAQVREHSLLLGRAGAVQKVAAFLLELGERDCSTTVLELAMNRQDIADYLGLRIETVCRTLSQLARNGVIEQPTTRRVVVKDQATLRALTNY